MKRIKFKTFFLFILLLSLFVTSCSEVPRNTAEYWEKNESKINEYNKKLEEWLIFTRELDSITAKGMKEYLDLDLKKIEAAESSDLNKAKYYSKLESDKCLEIIENLSKITVPERGKELFQITIDYFKTASEYCLYISEYIDSAFDHIKADNLFYEMENLIRRQDEEMDRLILAFNKEAKELGQNLPFP